jgi:hypothetical protein
VFGKESHFSRLRSLLGVAAVDLAQKEQAPNVEWLYDPVRMPGAIPDAGQLVCADLQASLLTNLSGDGLGGAFVHIRLASW